MPDLHHGRIPEFVDPSPVEPDSKVRLAKDFDRGTKKGAVALLPWFTGSGVKDLGRIAAGR